MTRIDNHIDRLITDPEITSMALPKLYLTGLGVMTLGVGLAGLGVLGQLGNAVRAGYPVIMTDPLIAAKQIVPLMIVAAAVPLLIMLTRPETRLAGRIIPLLSSLIIMPLMMLAVLVPSTAETASRIIIGNSVVQCLITIPLLAMPILLAQIAMLRRGAVTKPLIAGWLAGLTAGGIAAAIYAMVCIEDNPGFYGLWYSIDILIAGCIGIAMGKFALKW